MNEFLTSDTAAAFVSVVYVVVAAMHLAIALWESRRMPSKGIDALRRSLAPLARDWARAKRAHQRTPPGQ